MKLFKALIYILLFVGPVSLSAQTSNRPVCGTDYYREVLLKNNPELVKANEDAENLLRIQNTAGPDQLNGMATTTIIPVVFHIIHMNGSENLPESVIKDQIKRLNEDYKKLNSDTALVRSQFKGLIANFNIEFRLARIDPYGNCTNGITRYFSDLTENANDNVKSLTGQQWTSAKYLNIWVVKSIDGSISGQGTVLGYAYFPTDAAGKKIDGVVIRSDVVGYDKSDRTLTHEVGHYLGLYHTFQGGCASDCASGGDKVCDTPPAADMNFGCDKATNTCTESSDMPDLIENYMDYTDCTYMFTNGQRNRAFYFLPYYRAQLYSSSNLSATGVLDTTNFNCKVIADFVPEQTSICAGTPLTFINTSKISSSVWYQWQFNGGTPYVTGSKNPSVTYSIPGKYNVKLVVKNSSGGDSITKQNVIMVYPQNGFNTLFHENFESATLTPDYWIVDPPVSGIGWSRTSKSAYTGGYSFYINNFASTQAGQIMSFTLPPVNLTGLTAPILTFKYAFAAITTTHTDKLIITVSDDCGSTWAMRRTISAYKLPTTYTLYSSEFIPNSSTLWTDNILDLSSYLNATNLLVKFEFTTGSGNNIYIDDIRIGLLSGIKDQATSQYDLNVYPNPVNSVLYLNLPSLQSEEFSVLISDFLGNQIYSGKLSNIQNNISSINLRDAGIVKSGMYLIRLITKDRIYSKTFSVTE